MEKFTIGELTFYAKNIGLIKRHTESQAGEWMSRVYGGIEEFYKGFSLSDEQKCLIATKFLDYMKVLFLSDVSSREMTKSMISASNVSPEKIYTEKGFDNVIKQIANDFTFDLDRYLENLIKEEVNKE